jgi:hypothetical protein
MKKSLLLASLVAGSLAFGNTVAVAQQVEKLPPNAWASPVNLDGELHFDNMVVHCLVTIRVVKGEQGLYGACKETDKDGDYTSTTFDSKANYFIGRTGKYQGITGEAPFTVETLPAPVRVWAP